MELEELNALDKQYKKLKRARKMLKGTEISCKCLGYTLAFSILILLAILFGAGIIHVFACAVAWKLLLFTVSLGLIISVIFTIYEEVKNKNKPKNEDNTNDK